jgi:predicted HicB family RNase H-like nuclease
MSDKYPQVDLDEEVVLDAKGRRITEQRAERLAKEISEKAERRGRPSLSGGSKHSPRINVRLPQSTYDELSRQAAVLGESLSQLVRQVFEAMEKGGALATRELKNLMDRIESGTKV